ncbi:hypothetical protein Q4I28_006655 [Leishmania naiffi]|uniref:Uncharacterized protein n=1 Tax=Leishmania naiffi TaxID=5678 RepID=A0AAW3B9Q1_9TRYP
MPKTAFAAEHTHSQPPTRPGYGDGCLQAPPGSSVLPGFGVSAHVQRWPLQPAKIQASSTSHKRTSPGAIAIGGATVSFAGSTAAPGQLSIASFYSPSPAPPACTGAALLAGYTKRRKTVQKAATLSALMRRQVQDVVQMEEEQRLLSQAYRGRQKLLGHQPQMFPQAQWNHRSSVGSGEARATGKEALKRADSVAAEPLSKPGLPLPTDSASPVGATAASPDKDNPTTSAEADVGLVLVNAFDIKHCLQQQAQEKSNTLAKMRGMQQSILELSEEAANDEERQLAQEPYETTTAGADGLREALAADNSDGLTMVDNADGQAPLSSEVKNKMEVLRELRRVLKEMLDTNHTPFVAGYSASGRSVTRCATATGLSGVAWLEQDATYRPPAPLHVFSTNAFAVTLEYLSDSIACIAHLADEVCVATTLRSRTDPVNLVPHLDSLRKWIAQAERCLDTAQRHLRHFQLGEVALLEGGQYEVNSLREQTLLLKESLTAQEQKVKTMEEAKVSVRHRLHEIRRRCYLWEAHLLCHRDALHGDAAFQVWSSVDGINSGASLTCIDTPNTALGPMLVHRGADIDSAEPMVPDDNLLLSASCTARVPVSVKLSFTAATEEETSAAEATNVATPPRRSTLRNVLHKGTPSIRSNSGAVSRPLSSSAQRTPSPPLFSIFSRSHQPRTTTPLELMEQRVARSWCNPYVRKQYLRQRAEQMSSQEQCRLQPTQQQLQGRAVEQRQSLACASASFSADLKDRAHNLVAKTSRAPTLRPTSFTSFDSVRGYSLISATTDITATEDGATSRVSLARLGSRADAGHGSSTADVRRSSSPATDFMAVSGASSAAAFVEPVTDLADVRALQLLQSLLRSVPSTSHAFPHEHADSTENHNNVGGGDAVGDPLLVRSVRIVVTPDEEKHAAIRQSIGRLSRYLMTCTTRLIPPRDSLQK